MRVTTDAEVRNALVVLLATAYTYRVADIARIFGMEVNSARTALSRLPNDVRLRVHALLDFHHGAPPVTDRAVVADTTPAPVPSEAKHRTPQPSVPPLPAPMPVVRHPHIRRTPRREADPNRPRKPRGVCPVCEREYQLRMDGRLRHHKRHDPYQRRCDGTHEWPLPAAAPEPVAAEVSAGVLGDVPVGVPPRLMILVDDWPDIEVAVASADA
ncbi:hypothetical protein [Saccharothrix sp. HUAS TT1]|uniref:hypothetical protein n=1 Tax=unclassified Saccharothrix TaxID=2593673 RepID=UPI00345B8EF3